MSEFVTPRAAAQRFGVSLKTLRVWDSKGKISSVRTPGGHRRYDIHSVEGWHQDSDGNIRWVDGRRSAPTEAGRQDDDGEAS